MMNQRVFDMRWGLVPALAICAIVEGANPFLVALIGLAAFPVYIRY